MKLGKKILFLIIIGMLFIPMIQNSLNLFDLLPLKGSFGKKEKPSFTLKTWFEGEFQTNYNVYYEENIGFRTFFVRLHNQIFYSLYNIAKANGVIIGKENCLYEESYIKNYLGIDFSGEENVKENVKKLKFITEKLTEKNIKFIFVLAPSKARYYNEFFPDKYNSIKKQDSYKEYYLKYLSSNNINFLDLDTYFSNNKTKSQYPLYSKCGIHWSTYGVINASDTLSKHIESIIQKDIPELIIDSIEISNKLRDTDYDIAEGMNLLFNIPHTDMAYPKYHFISENKYKPSISVISDSYFWNIMGAGIASNMFSECNFYYYFNEVHYIGNKPMQKVNEINVIEELEKTEIVMFLATEGTMHKFSYGFIEKVYDGYIRNQNYDSSDQAKIEKYKTDMLNNPEWLEQIKQKAKKEGVSLDEMMQNSAIWMLENNK